MCEQKSFVDHIAIYVTDIHWYIDFFEKTLGMEVKQLDGDRLNPRQVWTMGGLQFIQDQINDQSTGPLAHIAIVTENLPSTLANMYSWDGVKQVEGKEENWVQLPDGIILEMF